jgi:hypothetical protein
MLREELLEEANKLVKDGYWSVINTHCIDGKIIYVLKQMIFAA